MITKKEVSFLFQCDCPNCKEYNPVIFRAFCGSVAGCYRDAVKAGWIFYRAKDGTLKTFYAGCLGEEK